MRLWPCLVVTLALAMGGCKTVELSLRPPPPVQQGKALLTPDKVPKDQVNNYMLLVRLSMVTVQLPLGSVSDSEELWSYVNEEAVGGRAEALLGANGVRIGLGKESDWPDIDRIIRRLSGQALVRSNMMVLPGAVTPLVLKEDQETQTIFLFAQDRTLAGCDYPPGDNLLSIMAGINQDDYTTVHLTGCPIIRSTQRKMKVTDDSGMPLFRPEPTYFPLPGMEFSLKAPVGGFLVIGPGRDIRRKNSAGRQFLVRNKDGLDYETVLIIVPEIFAAPMRDSAR